VYGFVAGIVKLDDAGLYLSRRPGAGLWTRMLQAVGTALVHSAPWLMRILAVVGTAAMFLVGGGILVHGLGPLHHGVQALLERAGSSGVVQAVLPLLLNALVGVVAGALVLLGLTAVQRVSKRIKQEEK
jgi:uncharacterized protein